MIILVDMDGVIADFERGFFIKWRKEFPKLPYIRVKERTMYHIYEEYTQEFSESISEKVSSIYHSPGFYRTLPVISGAHEALEEMAASGHEVYICTSPMINYKDCILEKYLWLDENLGGEWVKRVVMTRDKTMVRGDILIDDKPEIKGSRVPLWQHVIFDRPYNRDVLHRMRISWSDWNKVIPL